MVAFLIFSRVRLSHHHNWMDSKHSFAMNRNFDPESNLLSDSLFFANERSEGETQNNPHSECLGLIGNSEKFLKGCLLAQKLANVPISKEPYQFNSILRARGY